MQRFLLLLALQVTYTLFTFASPTPAPSELLQARTDIDFIDPRTNGGSMLDFSAPEGGEPLNVIISAKSSPEVLNPLGFFNYILSLGFAQECLGQHLGNRQTADLGDGHGRVNETAVWREAFGSPLLGTCLESLVGGNHFRSWQQNGPKANTGAIFLAASVEEDVSQHHNIVPNGYNLGRDRVVQAAMKGTKSFGMQYETTVKNITGLMPAGKDGINHGIAVDGIVALLTVKVKESSLPFRA